MKPLVMSGGLVPSQIELVHHHHDDGARRDQTDTADDRRLSAIDPVAFVRAFMARQKVEVRFDGSLHMKGRPLRAESPEMVEEYLGIARIDPFSLTDLMLVYIKVHNYKFTKGDIDRALRIVTREHQQGRHQTVLRPLFDPLTEQEQERAKLAWVRLGATLFDMDDGLAVAIFQHFAWQVKQKTLDRPVLHHLMPIAFSAVQGSGKTTFANRWLSPLRELATSAALLSDFADPRSGDIYRYPVVFIDDVEKLDRATVPKLKGLLTAGGIRRRRLGTSTSVGFRQVATLFGTANSPIEELVTDATGHRRFAMLPFRNGQVAKGGDPEVWKVVSATDYVLLWRSVNAFKPSPIEPYLAELYRHQAVGQPKDVLLNWLRDLDLNSEEVSWITIRHGVRSQGLHDLYCAQTGVEISGPKFAAEMARHASDPTVPFGPKFKT